MSFSQKRFEPALKNRKKLVYRIKIESLKKIYLQQQIGWLPALYYIIKSNIHLKKKRVNIKKYLPSGSISLN